MGVMPRLQLLEFGARNLNCYHLLRCQLVNLIAGSAKLCKQSEFKYVLQGLVFAHFRQGRRHEPTNSHLCGAWR